MLTLCHVALAALLAAAGPEFDTLLLQNGGRLVGTVVEESPTGGVTIQLPGGQIRTVPPADVFRIEYRDGTFGVLGSRPGAAPPGDAGPVPPAGPDGQAPVPGQSPPPPPPPPPPRAPPPPPPAVAPGQEFYPATPIGPPGPPPAFYAPRRRAVGAPGPAMFALGLGLAAPGGSAEPGRPMDQVLVTQFLVQMEAGLRFTPQVMGSLLLDLGFGDSSGTARADCRAFGMGDCQAVTARFGLQLRYAFTPLAPTTGWVSIGTGAEASGVSYGSASSRNDLTYSGWEALRLGTGVDFRTLPGVGWGLFAGVGFGRYSEVQEAGVTSTLDRRSGHTWVQAGVRMVLFP